ncbi:MAG: hypothetical protein LAO03_13990 [Acidobacteriia bacterium]|nr:hypothetical protein [Terriglobia bacterium]
MTRTNRNFVIAYALLVALPVAGLLGVLRYGSSLQAPVSVDGVWEVQSDRSPFAALLCGQSFATAEDLAITISQSGKGFSLDLANGFRTKAAGVIEGNTLSASLSPPAVRSSAAGCETGRVLQLTASVDPKAEPKTLAGVLSVADCSACVPVEFRAIRPAPARKRGPH